jgi:hypothetical protein
MAGAHEKEPEGDMTVETLRGLLDDYGGHVGVKIQKSSGAFANIHGVTDEDIAGVPTAIIWSNDL